MTKKHYILIADAIKNNECCANCVDKTSLINDLINIFKQDNNMFNSAIFKGYINKQSWVTLYGQSMVIG